MDMTPRKRVAAGAAAAVAVLGLATGGFVLGDSNIAPFSAAETTTSTIGTKGCNDWPGTFTDGECMAAGFILTSLSNVQPAVQFCKWKAANPGEWDRLSQYASTGTHSTAIYTWLGGSIQNELEAYFGTRAPTFSLPRVPLPPNACGGKIIKPPIITGVTPGESSATVTVTTTP